MQRLWENDVVNQESGLFAGNDRIRLMFPARRITEVTAHSADTVYEEGRDWLHTPGSDEIVRTPDSRIPRFSAEELRPVKNLRLYPDPDANAIDNAVDGGYLLFNNGSMLALHQIDISYRREGGAFASGIDRQPGRLPGFRGKLARGGKVRVTLIGDSISQGFNATGFTGIRPFAPPYIQQVCDELSRLRRCEVIPVNRAIEGTGIQDAERIADGWCGDRPDLLIIAYGMNNYSWMPPAEFITRLREIIDRCRSVSPESEFLVVVPMTGHPLFRSTAPGPDLEYARTLREFAAAAPAGTALADVQMVWRKFLERKSFYDLTGNGVNHPNDYGHRIYASVLLEVLTGESYF